MGYSRFSTRFRKRGFKKVMVGAKPKPKYAPKKKYPVVSFNKRVNALISQKIENKNTATLTYIAQVCTSTSVGMKWYLLNSFHTANFGGNGLFEIQRGTQDNHRIGNLITLKKWVIRGHISPANIGINFTEGNFLQQSFQGYVDVYFGKRLDGTSVDTVLPNFLNNGSGSETPSGSYQQVFHTVNKDLYKVYYHRRFKMGASFMGTNSTNSTPNNDFALTKTFGFDVCKYVCKNLKIKYNDQDNIPVNNLVNDLALWTTWTPAAGSLENPAVGKGHYYNVMCATYAQFEDA